MKHEELTEKIIKAFYTVYNTLGYGFLEKVYERAMIIELLEMGIIVESQTCAMVYYRGREVGRYNTDLYVEDAVACELKASEHLVEEDEFQLVNFLKATPVEVGLLLHFGKKPTIRRKVFDNELKPALRSNPNP